MAAGAKQREAVDRLVTQRGVVAAGLECGVAGLLYTYRCTSACRHCGFGCAGSRPDVHMSVEQAVAHSSALHELGRVVHVAGGECTIYWDALCEALSALRDRGLSPHFIETNASWATEEALVRRRLGLLRDLGVRGVLLSADPYHQAFIPPERVIRARRAARELFGAENVWASEAPDEQIRQFAAIARDEQRLRAYVRRDPPVLVGTAFESLRGYLDDHPLDALPLDAGWRIRYQRRGCAVDFQRETLWELHIDPYDNILTNCGVVLGDARKVRAADVVRRGPDQANAFARRLARDGPFGLARFAADRHGYEVPARAQTKCSLCYQLRKFLRGFYPEVFGPAEVYAA